MVKSIFLLCLLFANPLLAGMRCDGVSSRAFVYPGSTNLNITNDITISLWLIKEAGFPLSSEYVQKGRNDGAQNACNFALRDNGAAGGAEFYWSNPNGSYHQLVSNTGFLQTNTPIHIALTHQFGNTNNTMFWLNGARAGVKANGGSPQSTGAITNANSLCVGGFVSNPHVKGTILELAIWNTRLSAIEIASLAKAPMSKQPFFRAPAQASLMGYWTFTEPPTWLSISGRAWSDYSGWNCALTATNSPQSRPGLLTP